MAAALAAPSVYAAAGLPNRAGAARDAPAGGLHPVLLTRLFLLVASAVLLIVLVARASWLMPVAVLPSAALWWLAAHYAESRSASWVVLGLSLLLIGPVVLAVLASLG